MTGITFRTISHDAFVIGIEALAVQIEANPWKPSYIVGIGRGGLVPGCFLSHRTGLPVLSVDHSSKVFHFAESLLVHLAFRTRAGDRFLFIDDINDSGKTLAQIRSSLSKHGAVAANIRFAVLIDNERSAERVDYSGQAIDRAVDKDWFVFPWEAVAPASTLAREAVEDPNRLGIERGP